MFRELLILLICLLIIWWIQDLWKRRKLYAFASKINGPLPLPFIGNLLKFAGSTSETLRYLIDIRKTYKSPVRLWIGQRLFFLMWKPQQLEIILNRQLKKDELYNHNEILIGTGLITAPVEKWKRHKKIIMPTFNQKVLDSYVKIFSKHSEILVRRLRNSFGNENIDISDYVSRCVLDIICETAMDVKINAQTTDCEYMKWLHRYLELVFKKILFIWNHNDFIFKRLPVGKEFYYIANKLRSFTDNVIKQKQIAHRQKIRSRETFEAETFEESRKRKSFLDLLIELSDDGINFTHEELREEVNTFIDAGSDTSATIVSFTLLALGMFPRIQERVYVEVMDALGPTRPVSHKDVASFLYLERVIKEVMRLFPVVPVIIRALTEDTKLDSFTLPSGSSVFVSIVSLHRDPEIWTDPLEFNPDRFLSEEVAKRHPYSWLPFSGGPRSCIGFKYAMMSMKTIIATMVRQYRISTNYKSIEDVLLETSITLKPVYGYKVSIVERNKTY